MKPAPPVTNIVDPLKFMSGSFAVDGVIAQTTDIPRANIRRSCFLPSFGCFYGIDRAKYSPVLTRFLRGMLSSLPGAVPKSGRNDWLQPGRRGYPYQATQIRGP